MCKRIYITESQLKLFITEGLKQQNKEQLEEGKLAKIVGGAALGLGTLLGTASCDANHPFGLGYTPSEDLNTKIENVDTVGLWIPKTCTVTEKFEIEKYYGHCDGNIKTYIIRGIYHGKDCYDKGNKEYFREGDELELSLRSDYEKYKDIYNSTQIGQELTNDSWYHVK